MKTIVFVIMALSIFLTGCSSSIDGEQAERRDGLVYERDNQNPYTGLVTEFNESGKKRAEGTFVDGKRDGKVIWWLEDGTIVAERTFVDGVEVK